MGEIQASVLVVDDEANNREILQRLLALEGHRVEVAASGAEALERVQRNSVQLVLLDIRMPDMGGIEVLERIRERYTLVELPVIMLTALRDNRVTVEAFEKGASDYVTKPFDAAVVLARIQAHLKTTSHNRVEETPTAEWSRGPKPLDPGDVTEALMSRIRSDPGGRFSGSSALVGTVLNGKYRLESVIGTGASSFVYRATHLDLHRPVAVKVLTVKLGTTDRDLARFRREAISACRIRHPNAVEVYDIDVTETGLPHMVMELLEGLNLAQEVKLHGPMPVERCAQILLPVCDVVAEAHRVGIVHRDLKPGNIFLHGERGSETVKVVDFGLAKLRCEDTPYEGDEDLTGELCVGTPSYMAPERWQGRRCCGKTDVYSIGLTLHFMLAGQLPFGQRTTVEEIAAHHTTGRLPSLADVGVTVSPDVQAIIDRATRKAAAERPCAATLGRELAEAAAMKIDAASYPNLAQSPAGQRAAT